LTNQKIIKRILKNSLKRFPLNSSITKFYKKINNVFVHYQWGVMIAIRDQIHDPSWDDFVPLPTPNDRSWADPFIWKHNNAFYLFIEEELFKSDRGHISCLILDNDLKITSNVIVLEKEYHLSYPFIFEFENQLYMIPETKNNNSVELYKCKKFPDVWEFEKYLLSDVRVVDATIIRAKQTWWMFAAVENQNNIGWDTLHLYYSDNPISGTWTPHVANPVVKDLSKARPAGRIYFNGQHLVRPSQDCSRRYGFAINFNHITKLSKTEYVERTERILQPPSTSGIVACHTWNTWGDLTVIDTLTRIKPKPRTIYQADAEQ